jgi:hypothetical protein
MGDDQLHLRHLVAENTGLLEQGVDLIESLDPEVYTCNAHASFTSGVGRHFRHILDFYDRLLAGLDSVVDYEARKRDVRVETDVQYAVGVARRQIEALTAISSASADSNGGEPSAESETRVRLEVLDDAGSGIVTRSTIARELAALASHTVHHYAIIAMVLRVQGVEVDHAFGVAPSTLRHLAGKS